MWPLANYKQTFYTVYLNVSAENVSQREADHTVSSAKAAAKSALLLSAGGGLYWLKGTRRGHFITVVQLIRPVEGHPEGLFCVCAFGPQRCCYFITSAEKPLQSAFLMFHPLKGTLQQTLAELRTGNSSFHRRWRSSTNTLKLHWQRCWIGTKAADVPERFRRGKRCPNMWSAHQRPKKNQIAF